MRAFLERTFELAKSGTTLRTEVLAGITTFLTMAYIAFVNPSILQVSGMPPEAVITATCISAGVASILMGMYAKLPIGLAPGMGTNAYFAFVVCGKMGYTWQTALGAVFFAGIIFLLLTVTGIRERIIDAIPISMKHAIAAGIGLFIAFVGLKESGIIVDHPVTLVTLGDMTSRASLVVLFGLVVTGVLLVQRVTGALLWGILSSTVLAVILGVAKAPEAVVAMPPSISETFLAMDLKGALSVGALELIFAFVFVDLFDTIATLVGVADQGGLMKEMSDGRMRLPRATQALTSDAVGTVAGAALGTSTVTSYIESTSGIAEGGRTGLVAVVVGLGFFVMLFFSPIIGMVPWQATAPALVVVAVFMAKSLAKVEWGDLSESIPAVVACLTIPLTFSISNGLALGFILYALIKMLSGRAKQVSPLVYGLAILFVAKFAFLGG